MIYDNWHNEVLRYNKQQPKYGAILMVYYPFLMIEWYPNTLVVSNIIPRGPNTCTNVVEFYYPEDIALFEEEFIAAQHAAYTETAVEDMEICQRIDECGPYQHPMETGMQHFHAWLHKQLDPHLK